MRTLRNRHCTADEVSWKEVKQQINEINPTLFKLLEQINPSTKHTFIRVRYEYGMKIVDNGVFHFPTSDDRFSPLDDPRIPAGFKEKLDYCVIPLALVTHNAGEVVLEKQHDIIPLNYFLPGDLFGVFEIVDLLRGKESDQIWTVTSGARSCFMLPKIANYHQLSQVEKKYDIDVALPSRPFDQWHIYRKLAQHNEKAKNWYHEVIFFTNEWFKPCYREDSAWSGFYQYLFQYCLSQLDLDYLKLYVELDFLWGQFTTLLSERGLRPRHYLIATVKHLLLMANGTAIGFRPATDCIAAPIDAFTDIFIHDYELPEYDPLFMIPCKFNPASNQPIYYSLSVPIILEGSPYTRTPINIIDDERDLRRLLNTIKNIADNSASAQKYSKTITHILQQIRFEYFHSLPDVTSEIQNSQNIPLSDSAFDPEKRAELHLKPKHLNKKFCASSLFMKGCIKISKDK